MIISKTPLRISFVGGGSDFPSFYKKQMGAVVSATIDKYIYIAVNKRFEDSIRVSYSITEIVKRPEELKHEIVREALLLLGLKKRVEVVSIADIPSKGTGLGSSSAYTVGLLNALWAYKNKRILPINLAHGACFIEIHQCGRPIGKQDQFATAYGGFNYIQFRTDGSIFVDPIKLKRETRRKLQKSLIMFYTGMTRSSEAILKRQGKQVENSSCKRAIIGQMVELAGEMKALLESDRVDGFGGLLHKNWEMKKSLAEGISNPKIDEWYKVAREHGATGGKILGAGGGGFLLFYAPQERHKEIAGALPELLRSPFRFESGGSRIISLGG